MANEIVLDVISYNPDTATCFLMGGLGDDGEETALVSTNPHRYRYFILRGDWREAYLLAHKNGAITFDALKDAVYDLHHDKISSWSEDYAEHS